MNTQTETPEEDDDASTLGEYDISQVKGINPQSLHPKTKGMIRILPMLGINEIKDTNIPEVFLRLRLFEATVGPLLLTPNGRPTFYTLQDIVSHVGLKKNGGTATTMDYWRAHIHEISKKLSYVKETKDGENSKGIIEVPPGSRTG